MVSIDGLYKGTTPFTITDVPVGTHTLHAWHETFGTTTAEVTVTEGGTAEVELSLSWR